MKHSQVCFVKTTTRSGLLYRVTAALIIAFTLVACGGGGGGGGGGSGESTNGGGGGTTPTSPLPTTPTTTAPTVITHPQDSTVVEGITASFTVVADGTPPLTYQWKKNGSDITGAIGTTYTTSLTTLSDDGATFTVSITNTAGNVVSDPASLEVTPEPLAVSSHPSSQSVLVGSTATFSASATGSAPLTFQWRKNGTPIPGANSTSYITPPTTMGDSGALFDLVVTNAYENITSDSAALTVTTTDIAPTISKHPLSATAPVGASVAFVTEASGTTPLAYQWQRNGVNIPNATNQSLVITPVSNTHNNDSYRVIVTNNAGSATSTSATLTVTNALGQIDLLSGLTGGEGNSDGTGRSAHFRIPHDVALDNAGNLYVADRGNSLIRKVTPSGVTTTLAGVASFNFSSNSGSSAYVDGTKDIARFNNITSITADNNGNIYVVDSGTTIRKVAADGEVSTLAGSFGNPGFADGTGDVARFNINGSPKIGQLAIDSNGDIFVGDCNNNVIRRVTPSGSTSTFAGVQGQTGADNGTATSAKFSCPAGLAFGPDGALYVADTGNSLIRKIDAGVVSTFGTGSAEMEDLVVDSSGNVYIFDGFHYLLQITSLGATNTVAGKCCVPGGDGIGLSAYFSFPAGMAVDSANNIYVAEPSTSSIRKITPSFAVSTIPTPLGQRGYAGLVNGIIEDAQFNSPSGVTSDPTGNIFIADYMNCSVRKIDSSNVVSTFAGATSNNGSCSPNTIMENPRDIELDADGNAYITDYIGSRILKISSTGILSVLAGSGNFGSTDGTGASASFTFPQGIAIDESDNLYVSDKNNTIRKIVIATGAVTTLAGSASSGPGAVDGQGAAARFNDPCGMTTDPLGNIYVAECGNHLIRKITPSGTVTTIAGKAGQSGYTDGDATQAQFYNPVDITIDETGNLYIADMGNLLIRKISSAGVVSTIAGIPGTKGQAFGTLPRSMDFPQGIRARPKVGGGTELLVTMNHGVVLISLP